MSRARPGFLRVLAHFHRYLCMAVYLACALTPLTEGHGDGRRSAPTHIEAQGINKHYAHDESTCAACIVLSVIGNSAPSRPPSFTAAAHLIAPIINAPQALISAASPRTYPSRAPPVAA